MQKAANLLLSTVVALALVGFAANSAQAQEHKASGDRRREQTP